MEPKARRKKIFIAYSRKDADFLDRLLTHLKTLERSNIAEIWCDKEIEIGKVWDDEIKQNLYSADIILLLISADFIASDYCYEHEMRIALKQHDKGESIVVPVILKRCSWELTPFARFQALPHEGIPVNDDQWGGLDKPLDSITKEIYKLLNALDENKNQVKEDNLASDKRKAKEDNDQLVNANFANSNDVQITVKVDLRQIHAGATRKVKYKRRKICGSCQGRGLLQESKTCTECHGIRYVLDEHSVSFEVPKWVEDGMMLSFKGCGHQLLLSDQSANVIKRLFTSNSHYGDLIVHVKEEKDEIFEREGSSVFMDCEITVFEAMLGTTKDIKLLDGSLVRIKIPPGTNDGKLFRLKGKGLTDKQTNKLGDMLIKMRLSIPEKLTEEEKKLLKKLQDMNLY